MQTSPHHHPPPPSYQMCCQSVLYKHHTTNQQHLLYHRCATSNRHHHYAAGTADNPTAAVAAAQLPCCDPPAALCTLQIWMVECWMPTPRTYCSNCCSTVLASASGPMCTWAVSTGEVLVLIFQTCRSCTSRTPSMSLITCSQQVGSNGTMRNIEVLNG